MTALLTGLGIGLAFWIVTIPSVILVARRTNEKDGKETIKLMKERNDIDKEKLNTINERLVEIRDALYHLTKQ